MSPATIMKILFPLKTISFQFTQAEHPYGGYIGLTSLSP
jgi:hypothetical protein